MQRTLAYVYLYSQWWNWHNFHARIPGRDHLSPNLGAHGRSCPRLHGPLPFGRRAHRIDAHRRCAHPGACLSIDWNIFDRRCTARHGDRSEEYASQASASTLATELPAIINSRQIFLVRFFRTPRGYDPTELAVDKHEVSNLVNYILARKPFTLSRLERYRNTNGRK